MIPRPRTRRAAPFAALAAALLTAGCAAGPTVDYFELESAYTRHEIAYAGDGRDFAVTVQGALPRRDRGDRLARAVVAAMAGQPGWFRPRFTTEPGESARSDYRVAWLIGVPAATPLAALCGAEASVAEGGGDAVFAAVCRRDRMLSYAAGSLRGVSDPDDPRFAELVAVTTRVIMPNVDPTSQGNNDFDQ